LTYLARRRLGDDDAALAAYEKSLAMRLALGREHPDDQSDLGTIRRHRGTLARRRGRADEAVDWLRWSVEPYGRSLDGRPNDAYFLGEWAGVTVLLAD
jgi:hypothetical protein